MLEIGIQSEILKEIIEGRKTIEGRLAKGKFLTIEVGDVISLREDLYMGDKIMKSISDCARIRVERIYKFDSFLQMLEELGYENIIPTANSLSDALSQYRKYYTPQDEEKYGVIGFLFKFIAERN